MQVLYPSAIEIWRETQEAWEKLSEQGENQQQTLPTMRPGRNQTQATLVGGERSHHCAIPAPYYFLVYIFF